MNENGNPSLNPSLRLPFLRSITGAALIAFVSVGCASSPQPQLGGGGAISQHQRGGSSAPAPRASRAELLRGYEAALRCYGLGQVASELGSRVSTQQGRRVRQVGQRIEQRTLVVIAALGRKLGYRASRIAQDQRAIFAEYVRSYRGASRQSAMRRLASDVATCREALQI